MRVGSWLSDKNAKIFRYNKFGVSSRPWTSVPHLTTMFPSLPSLPFQSSPSLSPSLSFIFAIQLLHLPRIPDWIKITISSILSVASLALQIFFVFDSWSHLVLSSLLSTPPPLVSMRPSVYAPCTKVSRLVDLFILDLCVRLGP